MTQTHFAMDAPAEQTPTLTPSAWRWIVVNSSGGKDSQTALRVVVERCDAAGIPRSKIVVSHQCLGEMEWPNTLELVRKQCLHYGLRLEVSRYRDRIGDEISLLDYIKRRGKWPDNQNRYCTSEFKRGPGGRVLTKLSREAPGRILNVYGFRAEESPARSKKKPFARNPRFSSSSRDVWDWLPIHEWTETQVWQSIRRSGVPYHYAYDLGMPRLSCVFCIFAPRSALLIAGRANPELLSRYIHLEREMGHTFQNGKPIASIEAGIRVNEKAAAVNGCWNM